MNKQKKILIIGAGINQLPIIQIAKDLGYYVAALSCQGDYPGFRVADEAVYLDVFDVPAIIEYARNNQIDGVLSDQSDMIAPVVAQVAETLGLPTWGYENALNFTDKSRMRGLLERLGLPVPKSCTTDTVERALTFAESIGFPIVIKPVDSFASRGVFIVHNKQELLDCYSDSKKCSRSGLVIAEQYISGPQYFCQGFVDEGQLNLYAFSDRYYFNLPNMAIPYTNAFPAKISKALQQRMTDMFTKVVNDAKPLFGHVWAEWIYNETTDTLYIVEFALRGAGANVTSHLIPAAYGVDSQQYLVKAAMGDNTSKFNDEVLLNKSAAFFCFVLPEGEVVSVEGLDDVSRIPGVMLSSIKPIKVGDIIPPIIDKTSRFGMILIKAENRDEMDDILNIVKDTIKIQIKNNNIIYNPIWE